MENSIVRIVAAYEIFPGRFLSEQDVSALRLKAGDLQRFDTAERQASQTIDTKIPKRSLVRDRAPNFGSFLHAGRRDTLVIGLEYRVGKDSDHSIATHFSRGVIF